MSTQSGEPPATTIDTERASWVSHQRDATAADKRFLFYSHDGVGLGHVRRNLAIAAAVTQLHPDAAILIATSADEVEDLGVPAGADVLKLPGLKKLANDSYASRRLPVSSTDVRGLRASLLATAVESFQPTVMVADKHPLGLHGELRPALDSLGAAGGRAALGLRDILDDPATVRAEWAKRSLAGEIAGRYDRLLIYGSPAIFNTVREYRLPAELTRIARYCGYVARSPEAAAPWAEPPRRRGRRPLVLATAGGGNDGFYLLAAFIAAAKGMPWDTVVVSGRQATRDEQEGLAYLAELAGVSFRPFVPTLASWFPRADALVSMGGYNTLVEALAASLPTVAVPRVAPRTEQLIRTEAFARLGLLRMLPPDGLRPDRLRAAICAALGSPRHALAVRVHTYLDLRGAETAARHLLELAGVRAPAPVPALAVR